MTTARSERTLTVEQALAEADAHRQRGEYPQAEQLYRAILAHQPHHPEANHRLGMMARQLGRPALGLSFLRAALDAAPEREKLWIDYAEALLAAGQPEGLRPLLHTATEQQRIGPPALARLRDEADACRKAFDELLHGYHTAPPETLVETARRATRHWPGAALPWTLLAALLRRLGEPEEALRAAERAVEVNPADPAAHSNLGAMHTETGQLEAAETALRRALELQPDQLEALNNLANLLHKRGRMEEAQRHYRRALERRPDYAEAHSNLGNLLRDLGLYAEAEAACRRAIEVRPDYAEAHNNLGTALRGLGRAEQAEAAFRRAITLAPQQARLHDNLGGALLDQGRWPEAEAAYREALRLAPDDLEAHSDLLFCLDGSARSTPQERLAEARRYGEKVAAKARPYTGWEGTREGGRPLRVGFVSGDLRSHPVGHFLEGILPHLSGGRLTLFAYPTRHHEDALTRRIRPRFTGWRPLQGLPDPTAARLIHDDAVDLLIDLSGHTADNRLPLFAWKPAPIQLSWLGYTATTGVAAIDYYLTDPLRVPRGCEARYTEQVWRLPETRVCFTPPATPLAVARAPVLDNGHLTFGCFQALAKLGDPVLRTWSEILRAVPTARLRIQNRQLADPTLAARLRERLEHHGIPPARVTLHPAVGRDAYLEAHREVDLILDTFPYPGGTTTCEALWMGVPTLTLAGDTETSRNGASQLACAGLEAWVARSEEEYVEKAVAAAGEAAGLAALRSELRGQVAASPLFDAPRFARHFERALREMWNHYCSED
ncbi:tetratricopeptide repeat protein [Endothiovibrio diazotrophicus]